MSWLLTHGAELSYLLLHSLSERSKPLTDIQDLGFQPACGEGKSSGLGMGRSVGARVPGGRACCGPLASKGWVLARWAGSIYTQARTMRTGLLIRLSTVAGAQVLTLGRAKVRSIRRTKVMHIRMAECRILGGLGSCGEGEPGCGMSGGLGAWRLLKARGCLVRGELGRLEATSTSAVRGCGLPGYFGGHFRGEAKGCRLKGLRGMLKSDEE